MKISYSQEKNGLPGMRTIPAVFRESGQGLVEQADVTFHKDRWSALDLILAGGFLGGIIGVMVYTILPILKTLE